MICITSLMFFYGNGQFDLFDNSETHYTRVSQEMVMSGDYLNLSFNGDPWFVHPPLYFWTTSALTKMFGWGTQVLRFQEALFSVGIVLITYLIAALFFTEMVALMAALICVTSFYIVILGKLAIFDAHLHFFMMLSLYLILVAIYRGRGYQRLLLLAGVSTGLGILSKGPIALVQQLLILCPYLLIMKEWKIFRSPFVWGAIIISMMIAVPWYGHQLLNHGQAFFDIALKDYTWYRFFSVVEGQTGPWYYYFFVLCAFFPWVAWLPSVIVFSFRKKPFLVKDFSGYGLMFSWVSVLVTMLFFSVAQTKLPNYIYLVFPFLSIIMAHWMGQVEKRRQLIIPLLITVILVLIAGFSIQVYDISFSDQQLFKFIFVGLALPTIPFAITIYKRVSFDIGLFIYGVAFSCTILWLTYYVLPKVSNYDDVKKVTTVILQDEGRYDVIQYRGFKPSLMVRLNRNVLHVSNQEELMSFRYNDQPIYIITPSDRLPVDWISQYQVIDTWSFSRKTLIKLESHDVK